jgi:hypothetical protein
VLIVTQGTTLKVLAARSEVTDFDAMPVRPNTVSG